MKKGTLLILLAVTITLLRAQDAKTIFSAEKIVFYGLDFTKAKFSIPDAKNDEIKNNLFKQWNSQVFSDNGRFNKESAFSKLTVYGDPSVVEKRNEAVNTGDMNGDYKPLSKENIQEVISGYKDGLKKEGLGVVLIVEQFSKKDKKGTVSVTFFDIASRKVLLTKRMSGEPGGPGLVNYWLRPIQVIMDQMASTDFMLWKKEVGG
jgi:hypothetical protein